MENKKSGNVNQERLQKMKHISSIKDPNEYIRYVREIMSEDAEMVESNLFPLDEDPAGDIIEGFVGVWLAMCAELPITRKEEVVALLDDLINSIQMFQNYLLSDEAKLNVDVLRCLRKGIDKSESK